MSDLLSLATRMLRVAKVDSMVESSEIASTVKALIAKEGSMTPEARKAFIDGFESDLPLSASARVAAAEVQVGEFYAPLPKAGADARAIERAVSDGLDFLLWGTPEIELDERTDYQGGPDALECTQFVTWLLKKNGLIAKTYQRGGEFKADALRQGWSEVPLSEARVGDVVRLNVPTDLGTGVQHTTLLSRFDEQGTPVYLGANYVNGRFDIQVVSENRLEGSEVLWVLRPPPFS